MLGLIEGDRLMKAATRDWNNAERNLRFCGATILLLRRISRRVRDDYGQSCVDE
jgi:hypothetical protein